jgi:hypothetical protein
MPGAINYCDRCGNLILPSAAERAVVRDDTTVCGVCLDAMSPDERAKFEGAAPQTARDAEAGAEAGAATGAATSSERRRTSRREPQEELPPPEPDSRRQTIILSVALAGGIAVGVGVAVILASGGGSQSPASVEQPVAAQPVAPVAPDTTDVATTDGTPAPDAPSALPSSPAAAAALQRIASMRSASLSRYAEMKQVLRVFEEKFPGTRELEEAKLFEGEIDVAYAALAEKALEDARAAAAAMSSQGRHDGAAAVIRSVASRFGDGDWLATKGQALIDEALAKPSAAGDAETEKLLAKVREAFETGGIDAARELTWGRRKWPEERRNRANALLNELRKRAKESAAAPAEPGEAAGETTEDTPDTPAEPPAHAAPPATPEGGAVTEGLVAHWTFDEGEGAKAADSSGNGHELDVGKSGVEWRPAGGRIGGAVSFTKSRGSKKIDCGKAVGSAEELTAALWVKPGAFGPHAILKKIPGNTSGEGWGVFLRRKGPVRFFVGTEREMPKHGAYVDAKSVKIDEWAHVACTFAGGHAKVYINGQRRAQKQGISSKVCDRSATLQIGGFKGAIDDVRIYDRALTEQEVKTLFWAPELSVKRLGLADPADAFGRPATHGYALNPAMLISLVDRCDKEKVTPKKLAALGGGFAASSSFDALLKKKLSRKDGYVFAGKTGLASTRMTASALLKGMDKRLLREKPEVVRICVGLRDMLASRPAADVRAELASVVDKVLDAGAVPVLCTLPVLGAVDLKTAPPEPKTGEKNARPTPGDRAALLVRSVAELNVAIRSLAYEKKVPFLDAVRIVNADVETQRKFFKSAVSLKSQGYDAINARFLGLYRVLENVVAGRKSAVAAARVPPGAEGDVAAQATGPLARNGGFEEIDERTRLPSGWSKRHWGGRSVQNSARADKSNPHEGEVAMVVRVIGDGAQAGVSTSLALAAGTYEVTYWACAEVGKTADVRARLGGTDLPAQSVGDEWKRFIGTVEVGKKRTLGEFGVLTTSGNVRVWFDDVSVRMLRAKAEE